MFYSKQKNEEEEWLNQKNGAESGASGEEFWGDLIETLPSPISHLCVPSCSAPNCCHCCGDCSVLSTRETLVGHAFDLILVRSDTDSSLIACSDANFSFGSLLGFPNFALDLKRSNVFLEIENCKARFPIVNGKLQAPLNLGDEEEGKGAAYKMQMKRDEEDPLRQHYPTRSSNSNNNGNTSSDNNNGGNGHSRTPDHDKWALVKLTEYCRFGEGTTARIVVRSPETDVALAVAPCNVYHWSSADRIFVCDIDGTITKSNIGGLLDSVVVQKYTYCHDGVCQFLESVVGMDKGNRKLPTRSLDYSSYEPRIRILYLSSRPLGLAFATRRFLQRLRQPLSSVAPPPAAGVPDSIGLPQGPLLGFTRSLREILVMELFTKSVHDFKTATLQGVVELFKQVSTSGDHEVRPFWAGLGNTMMDAQAYSEAGMALNQVYIVNKQSEVRCLDRPQPTPARWPKMGTNAQRTRFPLGYRDRNIVSHILSFDNKGGSFGV